MPTRGAGIPAGQGFFFINLINYINKLSVSDLKTHPCIKEKYKLLKSGIEILLFIIKVFPIKKIITPHKGLIDAIIDEL